MILNTCLKRPSIRIIRILALTAVALVATPFLTGADGDAEWKQIQDLNRPIAVPDDWQTKPPTEEERQKHNARNGARAGEVSVKARDFYTRFPTHGKSEEARKMELPLLQVAVQLGATNHQVALDKLETAMMKDPKASAEDRFALRVKQIQRSAANKAGDDMEKMFLEFEKGVRQLRDEFPENAQVYDFMLEVASNLEHDKAAPLARDILQKAKSPEVKEAAQAILHQTSLIGKPLALKYESVDGGKVDLVSFKGKVVMVDFWATWCPPCVEEMPRIRAFYEENKAKGFEIVGISLDEDKAALKKFVTKEKMTWPQYFDGQGWDNKLVKQFQVKSVPTVWLVDKKGNLRYLKGNYGMKAKVQALLAEKS